METLAARAYMSRRTFDRRFRSLTGSAPLQWLITQRVLQAQRLLETSDYSVDEVAGRCGFRSPVALRGHFRRQLGSSPAAYRAAYRARRPQAERGPGRRDRAGRPGRGHAVRAAGAHGALDAAAAADGRGPAPVAPYGGGRHAGVVPDRVGAGRPGAARRALR
ncbi:hypothetical protein GCM10019016_057710 [Streptomyces prasinosporus]|uniref:HTH araC/xylS-type domain-containing protein n=1 Tax=Streptomyces prasinosporus TaxID=68256 RepID=A0ABP6TVB0_9ACTN